MFAEARIGTSGLERLELASAGPGRDLLSQYGQLLSTVEINSSFLRPPSAETMAGWAEAVPLGFQFSLKLPRRICHELRLAKAAARTLGTFLEAASELGPHLGPLLVQLPPNFPMDLKALTDFLSAVPRGPRLAFEFRHPSWHTPAVLRALSAHEAALVVSDEDEHALPPRIELTADFAYVRIRRDVDEPDFWEGWVARLAALARRGIEVYGYVKHDRRGVALDRARRLAALLRAEHGTSTESPLLT